MLAKLLELKDKLQGKLYTDFLQRNIYATDASVYKEVPTAVAIPETESDLLELVKVAKENKTSLIPRTAGTSLAGQVLWSGRVF